VVKLLNKIANGLVNIINNALSDWKNLLKLVGIIVGIILFIIIITNLLRPRERSFYEIENTLKTAAKAYYEENKMLLPNANNPSVRVDATELIENKNMNPLTRLLPRNTCTGYVDVHFYDDRHIYIPFLDCGDAFKTEMLTDAILKNTVTAGEGLHKVNNEFIYRGEKINNFVLFGNILWRVVKVDEDKNFRLIAADVLQNARGRDIDRFVWDDRYNIIEKSSHGINDYNISRIRHALNNEIIDMLDDHLERLVSFEPCIGKRARNNKTNNGLIECGVLDSYSKISLLTINEFIFASMDPTCSAPEDVQCQNYNYFTLFKDRWWTLTADSENTHRVYLISAKGVVNSERANEKAQIRPVVLLNKFALLSEGEGTRDNPFKVR